MHESWRGPLATQFESPYMQALRDFLTTQKAQGKRIFPKGSEYFRAFDLTPLEDVRVVTLGQDPYHGVGQIGRASCRERVCQYVSIAGVAVSLKKKDVTKAANRRRGSTTN